MVGLGQALDRLREAVFDSPFFRWIGRLLEKLVNLIEAVEGNL